MNSMSFSSSALARAAWVACAIVATTAALPVGAGVTDLASQPLATTPSVQAKPNLLFILDNSGSMDSDYMPDDMSSTGTYGYRSAQCNGVAYDPNMVYTPPLRADGSSYDNASFTAAYSDGYDTASNKVSLDGQVYYTYKGTQPKMGWVYTTTGWVNNDFAKECFSTVGNMPGSGVFTKVTMTLSSAASAKQNYANWYSYYRKRYLLMRTAMGRAISALDSSYRVGFSTISDTSAKEGTNYFRDVKDFDNTQRTNFYSSLYTVKPTSWTPLRAALSKAGRYYAKKAPSQTYDPMQYACQRNYTLMSTDGYWNTGSETSTYTGLQLDGSTMVGQQDGSEAKPMWDGQQTKVTTTTPYSTVIHQQAVYNRTYTYNVTGATYKTWVSSAACTGSKKKLVTYSGAKGTETDLASVTDSEDVSGTTTQSVVTLDGVIQSTTYSTPTSNGTPTVTGSSVGSQSFNSFSLSSYTSVVTATTCSTPTADSVSGGTKTLASTSDGSKTRTILSQSPVAATGASTVTSTAYAGGEGNTLADIAEYYYVTDLRTPTLGNCTGALGTDVCDNEVPPGDRDVASWQHMTTFTMGLGVGGILTYDRNYLTQTSGDYFNLKQGTISWPIPSMTGGGDPTNVDDLWHAAVNGRGRYFATTDPTSLADAINTVLTSVTKATGSSAAASTTSLMPVQGDNNLVFVATYTTLEWTGDLKALELNATTGTIGTTPTWTVQGKVDAVTPSTRAVYYLQPGGVTTTPRAFTAANLSADGYASYFTGMCSKATIPDQCASLTATQKTKANDMTNLVNYLRGDRTYENYTDTSVSPAQTLQIYRARTHLLGDIIDASPAYVGKPPLSYTDNGYADFVTAQSSRKPMVYVAANDGMLHAFSADGSDAGSAAFMAGSATGAGVMPWDGVSVTGATATVLVAAASLRGVPLPRDTNALDFSSRPNSSKPRFCASSSRLPKVRKP